MNKNLVNKGGGVERHVSGLFLQADDPELQRAWATFPDPVMAHEDEVLEYLGTVYMGRWMHCFRHRCHPDTNDRMFWHLPAQPGWQPCPRFTAHPGGQ